MAEDIHEHDHDHAHSGPGAIAPIRTVVLLGLGVYFAGLVFNGNLKNYTDPQFGWLALAAAVGFVLLGVTSAYTMFRDRRSNISTHEDHNHARVTWTMVLIVAVPLALGVLIPSRALDASALGQSMSSNGIGFDNAPPSLNDPGKWNILDWQRALNYKAHPTEWFNDQKAEVVGFIDYPEDFPADHFVLARWVMYHCALDARGVGLLTQWKDARSLPINTWVKIKGTIGVEPFLEEDVLTLHPDSVDKIAEPDYPYLRPYAFTP
jgi:uncharacterized repeat protein (TIGR03943 family)